MLRRLRHTLLTLTLAFGAPLPSALAQSQPEQQFGLVVGNSEYQSGPVSTAANDAGLIAQTLQAAGFDVMGARDLDGDALRQTFRDFVEKVSGAGPDAVAFVYLAGHGVQYEGENFFVPVDARIDRDVDVPLQALRLSDYIRSMGSLRTKAVVVVLDAARESPFVKTGQPLAGGLALMEPYQGMLYAYNAAPGTIAPPGEPPYGPYAQALAEMIREGGLPVETVFERVRMRVHESTSGAAVPWHASQVNAPFVFFERAPDAPQEASFVPSSTRQARPIRDFDAQDAYMAALERDTLEGYLDFLQAYPDHPQARRVRAIVAARREAITWRRARNADTPEAYWSYLARYPNGPHAWDARRRLAFLTAPPDPPPRYAVYDYGLPPPPPEEIFFFERRTVIYFDDPYYRFVPPPRPAIFFLPPRPPPLFFGPPPPRPIGVFLLPVPVFVPIRAYVRPPIYVAPPPNNLIFLQVRNQRVGPPAAGAPPGPPPAAGKGVPAGVVAAGAAVAVGAAAAVALPPSIAKRAQTPPVGAATRPGVTPAGLPGAAGKVGPTSPSTLQTAPNRALPGAATGAPLPPVQGKGIGQPPAAGAKSPRAATVTPPGGGAGQPTPLIQKGGTQLPTVRQPGQPPATGGQTPPKALATPIPKVDPSKVAPGSVKTGPPATATGQQRIERAKEDRSSVEQQLQQSRQRELERRRQEDAARQQARQQQQLQRPQINPQRQQQQTQAPPRPPAPPPAAGPPKPPPQQAQQKKCGVPGLPPCKPP